MGWFFNPLPERAYDFVMIDPPWMWENWSPKGDGKSPQAHYRLMPTKEVAELPVRDLLARGAVVWLWGTWPRIIEQGAIATQAWGLRHVTGGAWHKTTVNGKTRLTTGKVLRNVCDPFLILSREKAHRFKSTRERNAFAAVDEVWMDGLGRDHSRKPEEAYELVERMTPGQRRVDVFARTRRSGWDSFGDETSKFSGAR